MTKFGDFRFCHFVHPQTAALKTNNFLARTAWLLQINFVNIDSCHQYGILGAILQMSFLWKVFSGEEWREMARCICKLVCDQPVKIKRLRIWTVTDQYLPRPFFYTALQTHYIYNCICTLNINKLILEGHLQSLIFLFLSLCSKKNSQCSVPVKPRVSSIWFPCKSWNSLVFQEQN